MKMHADGLERYTKTAGRGIHERPAARQREGGRREEHAQPMPQQSDARRSRKRPGMERLGRGFRNTRFQPSQSASLTAAQVPRLKLKWAFGYPAGEVRQRATDRGFGTRLCRQRQRFRVLAGRHDRLRLLVVREWLDRAECSDDRTDHRPGLRALRRLFRRRTRQRLRAGRAKRQTAVEDQGRSALRRAHHRGSQAL